ncbi:MAG: hypothetical protein ACOZAA_09100 [Pseudomonadota bacterium]
MNNERIFQPTARGGPALQRIMIALPKQPQCFHAFTRKRRRNAVAAPGALRLFGLNFLLILAPAFASYPADLVRGLIEARAIRRKIRSSGRRLIDGFAPDVTIRAISASGLCLGRRGHLSVLPKSIPAMGRKAGEGYQ